MRSINSFMPADKKSGKSDVIKVKFRNVSSLFTFEESVRTFELKVFGRKRGCPFLSFLRPDSALTAKSQRPALDVSRSCYTGTTVCESYVRFPQKYPRGTHSSVSCRWKQKRRCTSTSSFLQLFGVRLITKRYVRKPANVAWLYTYVYVPTYPPIPFSNLTFAYVHTLFPTRQEFKANDDALSCWPRGQLTFRTPSLRGIACYCTFFPPLLLTYNHCALVPRTMKTVTRPLCATTRINGRNVLRFFSERCVKNKRQHTNHVA